MPIKFTPNYTITSKIAGCLMRIEAAKEKVLHLPLTVSMLSSLRETARLYTTHYSTMIEGNRLEPKQIEEILKHKGHFPRYKRDENEVKGYYAALTRIEQWAARRIPITEKAVQTLHALVIASGKSKIKPTPYRDGQNVIRDSRTRAIIYMPPEAKDVPKLMSSMIDWIRDSEQVPCPIIAGIAHYQFVTIHPYYDGNGRTARLLTTLILHLGGYDLKGLYSLEEYYAKNLGAYYEAISIGPSHNYYMGRAEADITKWIDYFVEGVAIAFENVLQRINEEGHRTDQTDLIRKLDPKQRRALELFGEFSMITASQVGKLFNFKPRTSAQLCKKWVEMGFIEVVDFSNRGRKYKLSKQYEDLISN
ncbi:MULTISPECIES: Fic family protein [unclassified Wolbachia]|uniref:Fic family protein n=1 Tax=unclassified Wolbachia TaxID=2640676 RepID=UPI0022261890|nr:MULTISPECIES: Fic family protein [unclassified Wolbachia]